jgi:hypothetical protein
VKGGKEKWGNSCDLRPQLNDHYGLYSLNSYYAYVFCCEHNIPKIKLANSGEIFIIGFKIIRKTLAKIGRDISVGPGGVPAEILKLGGEPRLLF